MAEFDYKQRPFSKRLTDKEYDRATGRIPTCPSCGSDFSREGLCLCGENYCSGPGSPVLAVPAPSPTVAHALDILSAPIPMHPSDCEGPCCVGPAAYPQIL